MLAVILLIYLVGLLVTFIIFSLILISALKEPDPYEDPDDWREWKCMMEENGYHGHEHIVTSCICSVFLALFWPGIPFVCILDFIERRFGPRL